MNSRNIKLAIIAATIAPVSSAQAANISWDWNAGDPGGYAVNNFGGTFESIHAEFDPMTNMFQWTTVFSDQVTEGFTLAVSAGPNPKGHAGELGLIYFDASNMAAPRLTAYGYNGQNLQNSWIDGDGPTAGVQPADLIMDVTRNDWIVSTSAIDNAGKRIFSFTVDASEINSHAPLYPDAVDPWFGIGFGEQLGLWMHPFRIFRPDYGPNGEITNLFDAKEGWIDGAGFHTPTPGSLTLASIGGLLLIKRRRK